MATVDVSTGNGVYLADFMRFEGSAAGSRHAWLLPVRKAAIARFTDLGFPTTRHEEWRFTNVARIAGTTFQRAGCNGAPVTARRIAPYVAWDSNGSRLVFVNGCFAPHLSSLRPLPDGVRVGGLAAALENDSSVPEEHLARYARYEHHAFVALNTAFMEDGAFIHIPRDREVAHPIHLIFVTTTAGRPTITHPRNLIVADRRSRATIVEHYVNLDREVYFTNAVTEVVVGENAGIDHYKLECESEQAFHIATLHFHQHRNSNVSSHTVSLGGGLVRNEINTVLDGHGCDCTLNGLYMVSGEQHVDNHLRVEHAKPHCNSREFFKGVLDGKARGVFSGRIIVHKNAQKTDAKQTNMNLLLSEDALIDTKPQLEIFADDVKCTHGATIGQIDQDAMFYLRSRGIDETTARSLLVYAFASEALARIRIEPLREYLRESLFARLPQGQLLREAV